ncbi:extracellular solute-binding protein [Paenibacillus thermoaerophilus]
MEVQKNMKSVMAGTMSVLVAASMAACSSDTEKEPETSPASSAANAEKKAITLEWLTYQYGPVDETAPVKKLLEEKFNVKFNIWYIDVTKKDELLGTKLAAGEIPDLMTVYSDVDLQKFYDQGITTTFTEEELNKYMPNYKKFIDSFDPKIWSYYKTKDGKYKGIPSVNPDGVYNKAVVWRKDWLDKVGITKIPETLDEFKEAVYKFRNDDPDGNGKKDTYGMSNSAMMNVFGAYGIWKDAWTIRDGKVVHSAVTPEAKKALETLRQWKADDVINPEWVVGENQGGYWALSHDFINGKIGTSSHGESYHWAIRQFEGGFEGQNITELNKITNGKAQVAFGKPPKGPDGKFGNILAGTKGTASLALGKNAADPEKKHRIMELIEGIYADFDLWLKVRHGEKGVNYDIGNDGISVVMKEGFKTPQEMAKIGAHITFAPFWHPNQYKLNNPKSKEFNDKNFKHEGAGYENVVKVALPSDTKYQKNLQKLVDETYAAIINGTKPLDYFDTFVQEWNKSGGEQLTKEANDWYSSLAK